MSTKKKTWTGQEKLAIVLQGLRGNCRISELCNEHGITQGMFYRWRDQLLNDGAKVFARGGVDHEVERLQRENRKLKETIGELTIELKKKRLGLRRKRMNSEANKKLLESIRALKSEHPCWGYRRIWAHLRRHQYKGARINHKRVYRLMRENSLLVPKNPRLKAVRTPTRNKPRTEIPNEYWGIDMTKVLIPSAGWLYLHVAIDWGSKKLLSVNPSLTSKSSDWIDTLNEAVNRQFPNGIREAEWLPHLVSDNGCQPTSKAFHAACRDLGIEQIFASYSNPKGNADTERVIRTLKEDLVWPREFDSIQAFESALKQWVQDYNEEFPHSALGYETPCDYERWFYASLSK